MTIAQTKVTRDLRPGVPGQVTRGNFDGSVRRKNLPQDTGKAQQVFTLDVSAASASDPIELVIQNETIAFSANGTAATDGATLADAIEATIYANGALESVTDEADGTVTVVAQVAGYPVEITAVSGIAVTEDTEEAFGAGFPFGRAIFLDSEGNATTAYPASGTLDANFKGVNERTLDVAPDTLTSSIVETPPREDVLALYQGPILVEDGDDASNGDQIFIGVSGADLGRFFTANSSDREALSTSLGKWLGPNEILINLPLAP